MGRIRGSTAKTFWMVVVFLAAIAATPLVAGAAGTPSGTVISNSATATYQDVSGNNFSQVSNTTTVTVTSVFSVTVTTPPNQAVPSNTTAYYAYTLTNTGNDNNTFALSAASGGGGWTVTLYADDGAGGGTANDGVHQAGETNVTSSTGPLTADGTYKFFVAVTVPANTANGQTDDTVLSVTGSGDAGAGDDTSDTVTTTAQAPTLAVTKQVRNVTTTGSFANTANAKPGETLEYQIRVQNGGTVTATNVVLTDAIGANTTYSAGSIWIGSNGTDFNGAGNAGPKTDTNVGDPNCAIEACGAANVTGSNFTAYLGNGATESQGGSIGVGSEVWVYFRVTVN